MPATRSILSVIRMMLDAGLPHAEIIATLDSCLAALPPRDRHPDDRTLVAAVPIVPTVSVDNGDKDPTDPTQIHYFVGGV